MATLRFAPSILSRLGEELVPNFDQGIIELVRNAYDADASTCTVKLSDIAHFGGNITISDNGKGMDSKDITNSWLVLGHSSKRENGTSQSGRIQVGDKGLGRLAALRMGASAELCSKPEKTPNSKTSLKKASVNIIWSAFDDKVTVEEVDIKVTEVTLKTASPSGTTIHLRNLKSKITRRNAERLARNLTILSNPFDNTGDFKVVLELPEYPDLEKMVQEGYLSEAEWQLQAVLNDDGYAVATVSDWKGDVIWETTSNLWFSKKKNGGPIYNCPPVVFDLSIFDLGKTTFAAKTTNKTQIKAWLKNLGGVHVYHNDFRVHPYGDPGSDWLDMNLARVNNPTIRPSTNNALGQVKILDVSKKLQQKTDRVGFKEDEQFSELKRFLQDSLDWYARERTRFEEKKKKAKIDKDKEDVKNSDQALKDVIDTIEDEATKTNLKRAAKAANSASKKRSEHLEKELNLYRSLATAGTTSAVFSHEISKPLDEIPRVIKSADKLVKENCNEDIIKKYIRRTENISAYLDRLAHFAKLQLNLLKKDKRRSGAVDVHSTITEIHKNFKPLLEREKIKPILSLDKHCSPKLNGSQSMLEAIITNCFTNSMRAFRTGKNIQRERIIEIRTHCEDGRMNMLIADSGPGIVDVNLDDIWLPGFTTMADGTGFGLTIIKDCVSDLGGSCRAVEIGELKGASFFFEFTLL